MDWKARMAEIKGIERIVPPEPERVPKVLAPGWVGFAYRIGIEPRPAELLFNGQTWALRRRSRKERDEMVAEFKLIRDTYLSVFPRGRL